MAAGGRLQRHVGPQLSQLARALAHAAGWPAGVAGGCADRHSAPGGRRLRRHRSQLPGQGREPARELQRLGSTPGESGPGSCPSRSAASASALRAELGDAGHRAGAARRRRPRSRRRSASAHRPSARARGYLPRQSGRRAHRPGPRAAGRAARGSTVSWTRIRWPSVTSARSVTTAGSPNRCGDESVAAASSSAAPAGSEEVAVGAAASVDRAR